MDSKGSPVSISIALFLLPIGIAIVLSIPAIHSSGFGALVLLNCLVCYPAFIGLVLSYRIGTNSLGVARSFWHFALFQFMVAFALYGLLDYLSHRGFYSYQFGSTTIVNEGAFTTEGLLVLLKHAMGAGLLYALAACCFWAVAWRGPRRSAKQIGS